ncbi:MAG: ABC transporter substrate-binding protein [Xanthobacteraceae bacterium]|nr:ABC transporter substrate-binding protein [Myxococcota bacterium]MCZ7657956.1 ABC transporter substrate-binding protein [Xanthobacteraceae bacterium]
MRKSYLIACGIVLAGLQPVAAQTYKLGVLNDQSSLYSDLTGSGSVTAARMAVADYGGKVRGQQIEIVTADHQNKPDVGASIARRWIDTEGVKVIIDVPASAVAFAVQDITREKQVPFLISGAASSGLTGKQCSPTSVHWTYDTYALAAGAARGVVQQGGKKWFFVTQNNSFGEALQNDISRFVKEAGGTVIGGVKHPLNNADFSSFLLQAQSASPDVIALANAGSDFTNALKQAGEFGITGKATRIVGTSVTINDVKALGLKVAQGVQFAAPFYWDMSDETRKWSQRFFQVEKKMPNHIHAGIYGAVMHYLAAVDAAKSAAGLDVVNEMKRRPVNDFFTKVAKIRQDGRVMRKFYLMRVKTPAESKGDWDLVSILSTIEAEDAAVPAKESECSLMKQN